MAFKFLTEANDYKLLQILFIFGNSGEVRWWVKVGWGGGVYCTYMYCMYSIYSTWTPQAAHGEASPGGLGL